MKYVSCSCGYVASAETGDELLTAVEAHVAAVHRPDQTALGEPAAVEPASPGAATREGGNR